jgi:hypothetical protein
VSRREAAVPPASIHGNPRLDRTAFSERIVPFAATTARHESTGTTRNLRDTDARAFGLHPQIESRTIDQPVSPIGVDDRMALAQRVGTPRGQRRPTAGVFFCDKPFPQAELLEWSARF